MSTTDQAQSPPASRAFVTACLPVPAGALEAFLRQGSGEPRGFWARGDRWIAHRGAVEVLDARLGEGDRFDSVRTGALGSGSTRFFGGFSFREDHESEGVWSAFPSGLFHLPELELENGGAGDLELRGRAVVGAGQDSDDVREDLERRLASLRDDLSAHAPGAHRPRQVRAKRMATDRSAWEGAVVEALASIRIGRVSKAVLARTLDVTPEAPVDPIDVVLRLWDSNRGTHVFLFEPEPGAALIGAAPETVATLRHDLFEATAVAGSIRRGEDPDEQAALAAILLASEKDREEQRIALDDMVERLTEVATEIRMDSEPHVLALTRIQHLETVIRTRVNRGHDVLDLVRLLHPTPAVCGLPRDAALTLLAEEEPFDRGWYAGPVGWFDGDGNGIFAPALRMAVLHQGTWRLFAGAGIVEGSVPALEWEETGMKFEPVLRALSAAGVELSDREEPARGEERRG